MAFGIPIINGILQMKQSPEKKQYRKLSKKASNNNLEEKEANGAKISQKQSQVFTKMKSGKRSHEERDNWTPPPEEINNYPDFTFEQSAQIITMIWWKKRKYMTQNRYMH